MLTSRLPPAVEIGHLRRLKETVFGGKATPQSSIIATDCVSARGLDADRRQGHRSRINENKALDLPMI